MSRNIVHESAWMQEALLLAHQPKGSLFPNPRVGAVITIKNKIVGRGFHKGPGHPHAEVEAIRDALKNGVKSFKNATLYCNLEPCSHINKRTPPCAPLLIEKKFKRVVVAIKDPNPLVNGKGLQILKKAGIQTTVGIEQDSAILLNQVFIKNQIKKLPYVTLKCALTFDGKMALDSGDSMWITGEDSRQQVQRIRSIVDGIGVGSATLKNDDPMLTVRHLPKKSQPKVVIFGESSTLKNKKINSHHLKENIIQLSSKIPLKKNLSLLFREHHIGHILIEGGPTLASAFLEEGLVDQIILFYGRGFVGGKGLYSLGRSWSLKKLNDSIEFHPKEVSLLGSDIMVKGWPHVYRPH